MFDNNLSTKSFLNISYIKSLGKSRTRSNFDLLMLLYKENFPLRIKREIVSSIGRHKYNDEIFDFITNNIFCDINMELIYQMYRTLLYKSKDPRFKVLRFNVLNFYNNEIIEKMERYYVFKHNNSTCRKGIPKIEYINKATILPGDNRKTLKKVPSESIQLIFTSPPYYNAREYSGYTSYKKYLREMKTTFKQCNRILEQGRHILINVSPVISSRPGREFESTRYPISFDFHKILIDSNFEFVDEIIWIKPDPSVPYRIGGYLRSKNALRYKPINVTESILVYRKKAPFLIDVNLLRYKGIESRIPDDEIDKSNCWYIGPATNKNHSAIFPNKLCEKVLNYYSYEGDTVLDPFAGTGTFGEVAIQMNRIPLLCESNEEYIKIIKMKIKSE